MASADVKSEENLYELWMLYKSKNDVNLFKNYLTNFLATHKEFVDVGFSSLNDGFMPEGPHLTRLPEGLLQMVQHQFSHCSQWCISAKGAELVRSTPGDPDESGESANDTFSYIIDLLRCLIVVCRNPDNVVYVASCDFLPHIVNMTAVILNLLVEPGPDTDTGQLMMFVRHSLHFLECLYDPYFIWRKHLKGWQVNKARLKSKPAGLHVEVVPFFYECFQESRLPIELQVHLFHVFGAVISGSQANALKAICPATLDVLVRVLQGNQVVGPSNAIQDHLELKEVVLQCLIKVVHIVHTSTVDMRQVEVGAVLEGYFQVFEVKDDSPHSIQLHKQMLKGILDMLQQSTDRPSLQVAFVAMGFFDTMLALLHRINVSGGEAQHLAMSVIQAMSAIMASSHTVKERFADKVGYARFVDALKSLGQPSRELLESVLDLAVEGKYSCPMTSSGSAAPYRVVLHNPQAALLLVQWLPDIQSHQLQTWLSESLRGLCMASNHNRVQACSQGMISTILTTLQRERQINTQAIGNLVSLLEWLGSLSITSTELKQLLQLLKPDDENKQMRYVSRLMHAMSVMSRKDGHEGALHYFDLTQEESGLFLPTIHKWNGTGFTFHAWFCLDNDSPAIINANSLVRRQLYSFTTGSGCGFEAFFTSDSQLVVTVCMKKEYHSIAVTEFPVTDQKWHCVDVIHASSKRPFTQSQLTVYIDGRPCLSALLKFPPLNESFTKCCLGCPQLHLSATRGSGDGSSPVSESKSRVPGFLPFVNAMKSAGAQQSPGVMTLSLGSQDEHYGAPVSLVGHVGMVCLFQEAIQPAQVKTLFHAGPNQLNIFQSDATQLSDLPNKLVFHYHPKACRGRLCSDLSGNQMTCQLMGQCCVTWDIKDSVNCIGGVEVIFPLLEQFSSSAGREDMDLLLHETPPQSPTESGWEIVPSSSYADIKLEQNQVAGFLNLLRHLVQSSEINQETLLRENAVSMLGALLQKVEPCLVDVNVLMSIQLFVDSMAAINRTLLHHIYQYLLFDFRIWCKSEFCVRIGHIQYLNTIIKEDRKFFRKKYGVQFMLDVIRTYYSSPDVSGLSADDSRTIRGSLFGLIRFYVMKEITFQELSQLLGLLVAVRDEPLVMETLDLLTSLLEVKAKQDQIFLLMFEKNMADLLYGLLSNKEYSSSLKEKVLKVLSLLLTTDKVYEKSKSSLRLLGQYPGLLVTMVGQQLSRDVAKLMLEQVLATDSANGVNAALSVLQMLDQCDIETKLDASKLVLQALFSRNNAPKLFAQQLGWQETFVRLFVLCPKTGGTSKPQKAERENPVPDKTPVLTPKVLVQDKDEDSIGFETEDNLDDSKPDPGDPDDDNSYHPSLDIPTSPSEANTEPTPQFTQVSFYNNPSFTGSEHSLPSRSSSTSLEDLTIRKSGSLGALSDKSDTSLEPVVELEGAVISDDGFYGNGGTELFHALQRMGLMRQRSDDMEKTEELCQNLLIILFTILWKGVEGSGPQAWKDRGQVLAAISYTSEENEMLLPRITLERRLLEMMLQGCIDDLKSSGQTNNQHTQNSMHLVKLLYNFLCIEHGAPKEKFRETILEDLLMLLDLLTIWETDNEWREMEQLGLRVLLAFAAQDDIDLCSIATARLHTLLQTRPVEKLQESCFVIGSIDAVITKAAQCDNDHYNFLIPVMKALVDKCRHLLDMDTLLPSLPSTQLSPSFFDDFKAYCHSEEWRTFMKKQVLPSKEQYQANIFDDVQVFMKTYIGECHEEMMISGHKRNRQRGESKLSYQSQILDAFSTRGRAENKRNNGLLNQQRNQHASMLRQWRSLKSFYTSERGVWTDRSHEPYQHWKLSTHENFCRMRPKLVPNHNFDPHTDASRLRDNIAVDDEEQALLIPDLSLVKEVKVSDEDIGDDRLGDEEWNLISTASQTEENQGKEKLILSEQCELITVMEVIKGRLEVTTTHVYFFDNRADREEGVSEDFKWALSQLREIHFRRYNLRRSALEFFLIDQTNYFLNFEKKVRNKVYSRILSLRPANLIYYGSRSPGELLKTSGLTQKWVQREISNFEYLMQLNTIAGRTYNDLSQYPVFPWILRDYSSETLDLENPTVYRDLSRPMGVVNPHNEKDVREKFESFEDPSGVIEKFHYGTHYSNAAGVMHYLLRMEPFTTLHIQLQSDRFDVADRQFHSIPATWSTLYDTPNDVKELIPEFFYLPEFLKNLNNFDLGRLQARDRDHPTRDPISDVGLPPWASSAEDFIHKHMAALESDHVSSHLHNWIDLIFGYKQKGPAAVEALNVFYYCTYEGAVDLDAITDPLERKALEGMINNFGQTPCQLLKEPHPKRWPKEEVTNKGVKQEKPFSIMFQLNNLKAFFVEAAMEQDPLAFVCVPRNQARSFIQHGMPDSMVIVTSEGVLGTHGWLPYDKNIPNYFTFEKDPTLANQRTRRGISGPFAPDIRVTSRLFAVSHDAKLVFSGGHWDNSLRVYNISKARTVGHIIRHAAVVTCLALDSCGSHLITGSRDTTCMVWKVDMQSGSSQGLQPKPQQILYGHSKEVTTVAISVELDMAVSGSMDGLVNIHTVLRGVYLHTLRPPNDPGCHLTVQQLTLSDIGDICVYCRKKRNKEEKLTLELYSINGNHLASEMIYVPIHDLVISAGHLIFGNSQGVLVIKQLFGLKTLTTMQLKIPITCLAVTNGNSHILAGLRDGKLIIVGTRKPEAKS